MTKIKGSDTKPIEEAPPQPARTRRAGKAETSHEADASADAVSTRAQDKTGHTEVLGLTLEIPATLRPIRTQVPDPSAGPPPSPEPHASALASAVAQGTRGLPDAPGDAPPPQLGLWASPLESPFDTAHLSASAHRAMTQAIDPPISMLAWPAGRH